jgi:hypothetical protein
MPACFGCGKDPLIRRSKVSLFEKGFIMTLRGDAAQSDKDNLVSSSIHEHPFSSRSIDRAYAVSSSASQSVFEVTTLFDVVDATDGVLSLREAISDANERVGPDTVTFAESTRGGSIVLDDNLGTLVITDDLLIDGDPLDGGPDGITIDGNERPGPTAFETLGVSPFEVSNAEVSFEDLTLTNGRGAAISATSSLLTVQRAVFSDFLIGEAQTNSPAIAATDSLVVVEDSTITDTLGIEFSGALYLARSEILESFSDIGSAGITGTGDAVIVDSLIAGNSGGALGYGIIMNGDLTVLGSTIANNDGISGDSFGIVIDGSLDLVNSTISGNFPQEYRPTLGNGLLISAGSVAEILNSTISGNLGSGIRAEDGSQLSIINSLVLGHDQDLIEDGDVLVLISDSIVGGVNVVDVFAATAEIADTGVRAGVLADNGGPTETIALLNDPTNPALNTADPADAPAFDQRGFLRDATPDMGSFELDGVPPTAPDSLPPLSENMPLPDSEIYGAPLFLVGPSGDAEISFVDEFAAFQSSLGVYLVGPDGTIGSTEWVFERIEHNEPSTLASESARPGGGPLSPGDTVSLSDLFAPDELDPGTSFGLFLVADGAAKNPFVVYDGGQLAFLSGDHAARVTDTTPNLVHIAENGKETLILGDILHTIDAGSPNPLSNTLNPGGTGQVTSGLLNGEFTIAFEDVPLQDASDRDFNDALIGVAPLEAAQPALVAAVDPETLVITNDVV